MERKKNKELRIKENCASYGAISFPLHFLVKYGILQRMRGKNQAQQEFNERITPVSVFLEYYNKNIPESYPHATLQALRAFQVAYPALFHNNEEWSIDKHRKRLMDWLPSYREA